MTKALLVEPDLSARDIDVDPTNMAPLFGDANARVSVAFDGDGTGIAAVYGTDARQQGGQPNPVASMAKNRAATGNAAFFTDPTNAICGPVVFIGADGHDLSDSEAGEVADGIRAVANYIDDQPEEYRLWHEAVMNLDAPGH
ncbi:hypothetical protein ACFSSC_01985 [Corynebacterium mendelii]|uniref:Uncharacterized protein n=1 Tax=Corynebacterium mendelii TaxID=2765362 RepID=A0A939E207_9CORY|nr:hypothetical protein [Corynebacterium mendelii]MBN9644052.1 hypothetical protein [Corynebacterium mendelii]